MSSERFHLVLTTFLAALLGAAAILSVQSSVAIGYPSSTTVSVGSNPIVSGGSSVNVSYYGSSETTLLSAPVGQDLVITDLVLQPGTDRMSCLEQWTTQLLKDSESVAQFLLLTPYFYSGSYITNTHHGSQVRLGSGIRVPAGEDLAITVTRTQSDGSYCYDSRIASLNITWSGYLSQP